MRWLYTLKPSTINIAPFKTQVHEYPEIVILRIDLSKPGKHNRIAQFINRTMPYHLVLFFTCATDGQTD